LRKPKKWPDRSIERGAEVAAAFPLQALLDHSRHRMEAAERLLRALKRKEDLAQQRLQELHGFKSEYQARLSGDRAVVMDIILLRDFYVFLAKLDNAIAHQNGEVTNAHTHWKVAHDNWLVLRQKVKAFETLADRHAKQEIQKQEKREQRITDETALRKHANRNGETF
jgi:flagellar protein FliJ